MEIDSSANGAIEEGCEVYPGQLLIENTQELAPGTNTYVYMGKVYAQVSGHVQIIKKTKWNEQEMDKIAVQAFHGSEELKVEDATENTARLLQPRTGDEVYARVMKVEDRFAKVDIVAIGEDPISAVFAGFLQQENVRDFDRSDVQMHLSFRPGDVIKARVTQGVESGGTSRDASVTLSTAEEHLGVVFARSQQTGALMVPRSWSEFECVQTKTKEPRKVAKVAA